MAKTASTNLGTENLKRVLAFLLMLSFELADLIKSFTISKAVALGFKLAENQDILQVGKIALAEFKDLSVEESDDVIEFIGVNFDLEDDSLEERIENGLELLPEGYSVIKMNIEFYLKASGFLKSWGEVSEAQVRTLNKKLKGVTPEWVTTLKAA